MAADDLSTLEALIEEQMQKVVEGGEDVSVGDRRVKRASLSELIKLRDKIKAETDRSTAGSSRAFMDL